MDHWRTCRRSKEGDGLNLGNDLYVDYDGTVRTKRRNRKLSAGALWALKRTQQLQIADAVQNRTEVKEALNFLSTLDGAQKGSNEQ
jgi:hypothetical protein